MSRQCVANMFLTLVWQLRLSDLVKRLQRLREKSCATQLLVRFFTLGSLARALAGASLRRRSLSSLERVQYSLGSVFTAA